MPRPGGTPSNGLYGGLQLKGVPFLGLIIGIWKGGDFTVEGYDRVGKSVIWVCEGAQKG